MLPVSSLETYSTRNRQGKGNAWLDLHYEDRRKSKLKAFIYDADIL
jgi:hypothetical protein